MGQCHFIFMFITFETYKVIISKVLKLKNSVLKCTYFRDALLIPLLTCLTSFYGGFVIFSVLGFMAKRANVSVKDVVASGNQISSLV